jgi:hypothetical protein
MISIPYGDWMIQSVLINDTTVMNHDGIRALEILDGEWRLQPATQKFNVTQLTSKSAVLESNGVTYHADFAIEGTHMSMQLSRPNLKERISLEAESITANALVNSQ